MRMLRTCSAPLLGVILVSCSTPEPLERIEPIAVTLPPAQPDPGTFEEARYLGLESYSMGDYEGAFRHLSRAEGMRPKDGKVLLYLGSSELMLGRAEDAVARLGLALEVTVDRFARDEALWQLINAELAAGNLERSARLLEQLVSRRTDRSEKAEELLMKVRSRLPQSS